MKKNLIALGAALLCAAGAHAQSSVQLTGLVDVFAQLQQAVISQMMQAPQTLGEEASKLSKDFDRGNMRFDSRDKVVAQIKLLTPQKLADFFHQTVVDPQGMTILSQISGSQNGKADYAQPKGGKVWENVSALQQSLPLMRENE